MKRRIRVITKATIKGDIFSRVYNGWIKGDMISDDEISEMPVEIRNITNVERYDHEKSMRERYRDSHTSKGMSQTHYLKI